jgi:hypothetical protein
MTATILGAFDRPAGATPTAIAPAGEANPAAATPPAKPQQNPAFPAAFVFQSHSALFLAADVTTPPPTPSGS